jgi:Cu/Ag efflux pump CusA
VLVGKISSEETHPIGKILLRVYAPVCAWVLRWKRVAIMRALAVVSATVPAYLCLGSEFMPPLDEGALLYMPSTLPGISLTQAQTPIQGQDRILPRFPERESVLARPVGRRLPRTEPRFPLGKPSYHASRRPVYFARGMTVVSRPFTIGLRSSGSPHFSGSAAQVFGFIRA